MAIFRTISVTTSLVALLSLAACGTTQTTGNQQGPTSQAGTPTTSTSTATAQYGIVQSINLVRQEEKSGVGAGTVIGAVVGGVLGNQVGKGDGKTAATVLGAAGGAYAGHQVEKSNRTQPADRVQLVVRRFDGQHLTVTQATADDIRVGDRVVVTNGIARRY